jgi:hypothetical protein
VYDLSTVHIELEKEASDSGKQVSRKSTTDHKIEDEPKWVRDVHAEHHPDLV